HLRFAAELGVAGVSRDPEWRRRQVESQIPPRTSAASEAPVATITPITGPAAPTSTTPSPAASPLTLTLIREEIGDCTRCKLDTLGRRQIVFGVGNPNADLMFVGEAPGADEDIKGEPFVGRAGQLLTKIIEAIDLKREDVYIANVIKCRPPENRNP